MTQLEKDILEIQGIITLFHYQNTNLTQEQLKAIKKINKIVYKKEYDYLNDKYVKEKYPKDFKKIQDMLKIIKSIKGKK